MTPEERAELKKKEIEAEFLRYKLARRAAAQRAAAEKVSKIFLTLRSALTVGI